MMDLLNKVERALQYRVQQAAISGLNIYTGQSDFEKATPSLVLHAQGGPETPLGSGNVEVQVVCEMRASADGNGQVLPAHRAMLTAVEAVLRSDDLADKLTDETADFHAFGMKDVQNSSGVDDDSNWLTTLSFTLYCNGMDLT